VFIPGLGNEYGTARSWLNIFGFSFQPSEIAKLTFLIFLAGWIQNKGHEAISSFFGGFLPFMGYLGIIAVLIALQPDLGTLMIIVFMSVLVYFVAGARISHLSYMGLAGLSAIAFLVVKNEYVRKRVLVFLHPLSDIQNTGYQLHQSFLAIGSGGLFGKGLGKSEQKFFYLPEVSSDSIFAIIAEELGFAAVSLLIMLFIVLLFRGVRIALRAPDPFGRFLGLGIITWIISQAFLNIAVMIGLAPLTGIPLPFISAGGTSLAVSLAAMGILVNISRHRYG